MKTVKKKLEDNKKGNKKKASLLRVTWGKITSIYKLASCFESKSGAPKLQAPRITKSISKSIVTDIFIKNYNLIFFKIDISELSHWSTTKESLKHDFFFAQSTLIEIEGLDFQIFTVFLTEGR